MSLRIVRAAVLTPPRIFVTDFERAVPGTSSIETFLPVVWTHAHSRGFPLESIVQWMCTRPALMLGIHEKKGKIAIGADADIVVWDPEGTRTISAETHHQNIDFNIYEGMEVTGIAATTLSRGSVVWENGELKTVRGAGRNVKRPPFPKYWDAIKRRNDLAEPTAVNRD